ncbi:MAG TPA: hypothetical protein VEC99_18245 [Clostridia bacterium]|nr:hypothetical protein [Clostridia bacterium]
MKSKPNNNTFVHNGTLLVFCLSLLLLATGPVTANAEDVELSNDHWSMIIDNFGYSDLALDQRPGFKGREYLSGEWAAAIAYKRNSVDYGPMWMNPDFLYPDWETGSDFTTESELTVLLNRNAYGFEVARSVIANGSVRITITSEMIDTTNGIPQGLAPRSSSSPSSIMSDRYVFRQNLQISNISGQTLSGVKIFRFIHSLQATKAVYDDRSYGGTFNNHHFTISQQGTDMSSDSLSDLNAVHSDTVALHANLAPSAWEVGRYGDEKIDDHSGTNKPSVGVHWSVEAGKLSGLDSFGPTNPWVGGAVQCDLGTLPPNGATNIEFLMSISTVTATKAFKAVGWGGGLSNPARVPDDATNILAIAAGANHSLALRADRRVVAWGDNSFGQTNVPASLNDVVQVAAGGNFSLALRQDGQVVGWGDNSCGQISIPPHLPRVEKIAAGANHSVALLSNGYLVSWGDNSFGQTNTPNVFGVLSIAAGSNFTLALSYDGSIQGWGDNSHGQLDVPSGLFFPANIAAGANHCLALNFDGTLVGWGDNSEGQIDIPAELDVQTFTAGGNHNLAILSDGTVAAWGSNQRGQNNVPSGLCSVTAIAAGGNHSLALTPLPPTLRLNCGSQSITLSWSAAWSPEVEQVVVEEASSLSSTSWTSIPTPGQVDQGEFRVTLPVGQGTKFYRLRVQPEF